MSIWEIVVLGIGLAMDAAAVSLCKGLSMPKLKWKNVFIIGLYFGLFQAIMPIVGYLLGASFSGFVEAIDHWIAFVLLSLIGGNMVKEARNQEEDRQTDKVDFRTMIPLAVATSIDALAIGVTLAFLKVNVVFAGSVIGLVTFIISFCGVIIGNKFGDKFRDKAKFTGGIVLILIGIKILIEHLTA